MTKEIKGCSELDERDCVYSHGFVGCANYKCWFKIAQEQMEEEDEYYYES